MKKFLFLAILGLTACQGQTTQTAREAVAASGTLYSVALVGAKAYAALPKCPAQPACHDPQKLQQIAQGLQIARAAVDTARNVVNLLPDATSVSALTAEQKAAVDAAAKAAGAVNTTVQGVK